MEWWGGGQESRVGEEGSGRAHSECSGAVAAACLGRAGEGAERLVY